MQRQENILRNEAKMAELGLSQLPLEPVRKRARKTTPASDAKVSGSDPDFEGESDCAGQDPPATTRRRTRVSKVATYAEMGGDFQSSPSEDSSDDDSDASLA